MVVVGCCCFSPWEDEPFSWVIGTRQFPKETTFLSIWVGYRLEDLKTSAFFVSGRQNEVLGLRRIPRADFFFGQFCCWGRGLPSSLETTLKNWRNPESPRDNTWQSLGLILSFNKVLMVDPARILLIIKPPTTFWGRGHKNQERLRDQAWNQWNISKKFTQKIGCGFKPLVLNNML